MALPECIFHISDSFNRISRIILRQFKFFPCRKVSFKILWHLNWLNLLVISMRLFGTVYWFISIYSAGFSTRFLKFGFSGMIWKEYFFYLDRSIIYYLKDVSFFQEPLSELYRLLLSINYACNMFSAYDSIFKTYTAIDYATLTYCQFSRMVLA